MEKIITVKELHLKNFEKELSLEIAKINKKIKAANRTKGKHFFIDNVPFKFQGYIRDMLIAAKYIKVNEICFKIP